MAQLSDLLLKADGLALLNSRKLSTLWAGYGVIHEIKARDLSGRTHNLILKEVSPPAGSGVSHLRKVQSYQVEAAFYTSVVPSLRDFGLALAQPLVVESTLDSSGGALHLLMTDLRPDYPNARQRGTLDLAHAKAALSWLARLHASHWQQDVPEGLWPEGSFWQLQTRLEELENTELEWSDLKAAAHLVDRELTQNCKFRTIVHGDAKSANFLFSDPAAGPVRAAAYDFQYAGGGDAMRDVAYLLCSSVEAKVLAKHEEELLRHYHSELLSLLSPHAAQEYTWDVMLKRLSLATCDFVRFMAGWGWWGSTRWAADKARACLADLSRVQV